MSQRHNYDSFRPIVTALGLFVIALIWFGCAPKWELTPIEPAPEPVVAENGMVVAAHPLAAEAGVSVLRDGGNAVDAAIAALFMLNVVEPHASGLGGGGFALVRMADGDTRVINYREKAPSGIDTSFYYDPADSNQTRMGHGGSAVCIPGAAAGWAEMYNRWHTLPLERLVRDAIQAAGEGFPVDQTLAGQITGHYQMLASDSLLSRTFLKLPPGFEPDDSLAIRIPYEIGDTLQQPDLAKTLRTIVHRGFRAFYRGPIAEAIASASQADGGFMTIRDLEEYRADVIEPIRGNFSGCEVLTIPPPSGGGLTLLEALNLFDLTGAPDAGLGTPDALHLMSQCIQQGYVDAMSIVADPAFVRTDWRRMLTDEHIRRASEGISLKSKPGPRQAVVSSPNTSETGNTTHLVVVDQWGNVVSLTQSINHFFGAGVIAGNTGLLLNNQMSDFSLPPDTLNLISGRKRPRSNMTPVIVLKDGHPYIILGTPGGQRIPAAMSQILVNVVKYDMDISSAIDYPRFFPVREHFVAENRFTLETCKGLKKIGYTLHLTPPYHVYFGGAHGIVIDPSDGKLYGAADKRRGGAARGY